VAPFLSAPAAVTPNASIASAHKDFRIHYLV
jgi:hypothetical protein